MAEHWFKFNALKFEQELREYEMAEKDSAEKQINTEVSGFRERKDAMHAEDGGSTKSK